MLREYKEDLGNKYELLDAIIASHHENLEWGSPVKPSFIEALIVARADNLSSSVNAMSTSIEKLETRWSSVKDFASGSYLLNYRMEE